MAATFKTRSEIRLAELEAIKRPLTEEEGVELRKCLHAIYMRQWRAEQAEREMNFAARVDHGISHPESRAGAEVEAIASRMEAAFDPEWPLPVCAPDKWEEAAKLGSDMLRDAINRAVERAKQSPVKLQRMSKNAPVSGKNRGVDRQEEMAA